MRRFKRQIFLLFSFRFTLSFLSRISSKAPILRLYLADIEVATERSPGMGQQQRHRMYPLTSLQIGDLQSYVSRLYLYLTCESSNLFILVDNRPWLLDNHCSPAQLWQLMVTKSRMSPFANTRTRSENKGLENKVDDKQETPTASKRDSLYKWFSAIDAARLQRKALAPVKELHQKLHGCVAFEVAWADVRGINYINELQTDTCVALEVKSMIKKEFDSIEQAVDCIASQCLGIGPEISALSEGSLSRWSDVKTPKSQESPSPGSFKASSVQFGEHVEDDRFYDIMDMQENLTQLDHDIDGEMKSLDLIPQKDSLRTTGICEDSLPHDCSIKAKESFYNSELNTFECHDDKRLQGSCHNVLDRMGLLSENKGPYQVYSMGSEAQRERRSLSEDILSGLRNYPGSINMAKGCFETVCPSGVLENDEISAGRTAQSASEIVDYKDVLIIFKFDEAWLPFELKKVITSDLRLLRLLESGLPSWVIFFQSYPIFCQMYCPWMRPLARTLYILISTTTVLIGFYDLYKNVPVLKATASRICGPLFDWIEAWEMISRLKYLGTMLFLQNFEKAFKWSLTVIRAAKQLTSILARPMVEPLVELGEFILPLWDLYADKAEDWVNMVWMAMSSTFSCVVYLLQILVWPFLILLSLLWSLVTAILYPIGSTFWELLITPIRLVLKLLTSLALISSEIFDFGKRTFQSLSGTFQLISSTGTTTNTNTVPVWRALWNDLFSQVFRAVRSIVNGFVAFFTACNRHRLSIYNHLAAFLVRLSDVLHIGNSTDQNAFESIHTHGKQQKPYRDRVDAEQILKKLHQVDAEGWRTRKSLDYQNKISPKSRRG